MYLDRFQHKDFIYVACNLMVGKWLLIGDSAESISTELRVSTFRVYSQSVGREESLQRAHGGVRDRNGQSFNCIARSDGAARKIIDVRVRNPARVYRRIECLRCHHHLRL